MGAILRVLSICIRGEEKARNQLEGAETYQDENSGTSENWTWFFFSSFRWVYALFVVMRSTAQRRGGRRGGQVCVEWQNNRIENSQSSLGQARLPNSPARTEFIPPSYGRLKSNNCSPSLIDVDLARRRSCKYSALYMRTTFANLREQKVYRTSLHPGFAPVLLKHRFSKRYRHSTLDASLTRARVAGEARALLRCLRYAISFQLLFDGG